MALNMPVFYKRTGSAIVFAAIMLVGLLCGSDAFLALALLISSLCLREYFQLMQKIDKDAYWPKWLPPAVHTINLLSIVFVYALFNQIVFPTRYRWISTVTPIVFIIPATLIIISVVSSKNSLIALLQSLAGIFYITIPVISLQLMSDASYILPIALILMIWTNDTMAYLVGSFIGKTPFSAISPKKTWEGTGGGALLTMIGAMAYGYFSHKFRLIDWAVLGLCAAVAGTLGDLVESKLKRMADVKDSGNVMPGHGGALDRFDSLLLAAPFAGTYVLLFM